MTAQPHVLGIDIGSGSCRVALLELEEMRLVAVEAAEWSSLPGAGNSQLDMEVLWTSVCELIRRVRSRNAGSDKIVAVSCASLGGALIATDGTRRVLWTSFNGDARPSVESALADDVDWIYDLAGDGLTFSAIPRLRWLADHEPAIRRAIGNVMSVGDWITYRLSGELATDASLGSSIGLVDGSRRTWSARLLEHARIELELLPTLNDAGASIGTVTPEASEQTGLSVGTQIVLGGWDTAIAQLAAGLPGPSAMCVVAGSFWKTGVLLDRFELDPARGLRTLCHVVPETWVMEGIGFLSGAALRWFRDGFCQDDVMRAQKLEVDAYDLMETAASAVPPGAGGVVALLANAMNARDWRHASAGFLQFDVTAPSRSGRRECIRAIEEAAAYAVQSHRLALEHATGSRFTEVLLSGGAARAHLWPAIVADVLNLPVHAASTPEGTAAGAARIAAVGVGRFGSVREAAADEIDARRTFEPNVEHVIPYSHLFLRWQGIYDRMVAATDEMGLEPLRARVSVNRCRRGSS